MPSSLYLCNTIKTIQWKLAYHWIFLLSIIHLINGYNSIILIVFQYRCVSTIIIFFIFKYWTRWESNPCLKIVLITNLYAVWTSLDIFIGCSSGWKSYPLRHTELVRFPLRHHSVYTSLIRKPRKVRYLTLFNKIRHWR